MGRGVRAQGSGSAGASQLSCGMALLFGADRVAFAARAARARRASSMSAAESNGLGTRGRAAGNRRDGRSWPVWFSSQRHRVSAPVGLAVTTWSAAVGGTAGQYSVVNWFIFDCSSQPPLIREFHALFNASNVQ